MRPASGYLESQGVKLLRTSLSEDQARAAVRGGSAQVVLIIPKEYGTRFAGGDPGAGALGRRQRGFANPQERGSRPSHCRRVRQRALRSCGCSCEA
jgi:hypothetical protein